MLLPVLTHNWAVTPAEAVAIQRELAPRMRLAECDETWRLVAGIDVGIKDDRACAAVVVLTPPELAVVEQVTAEWAIGFPYVPGLLSFREAPAILRALAQLESEPDVLMFDGQGIAHPRGMGIATHLGILFDRPTVGCAKSRLYGTHEEPAPERGATAPLMAKGEQIGAVVRTRSGVRPVYVSVGHRMTLECAVDLVLRCATRYRLPEPTRRAHQLASGCRATPADRAISTS